MPVSTDPKAGTIFFETLGELKNRWPEAHRTAGLSNISFGLPARALLNKTFLIMSMSAGLDSAILNPTEPGIYSALKSAEALLGNDSYCRDYLKAFRLGALT